ncbi:MAG: hypothetical protein V5A39_02200 [Haloarculaceae archaeon]
MRTQGHNGAGTEGSGRAASRRASAGGHPGRLAVRHISRLLVALLLTLSLAAGAVGGAADAGPDGHLASVGDDTGPAPQTAGNGSQLVVCDRNASTFVGTLNNQIDSVPATVRNRVRDSNIHLQVFGNGGGNYTMVADEQSRVVSYSEGKPESASLRVETNCETFRAITDSEEPVSTYRTAYDNDEIRFIGLGIVNRMFFAAAATLTDPISLAAVLFLLLLVLVALYVLYRRFSIHYRGGGPPVEPEE